MKYNSIYDMPYNVSPKSERAWETFVRATLESNPEKAFNAYHQYNLAREEKLKQQVRQEEFSM